MLILHRRRGESLVVGDDVFITVSEAGSDGVRLAIDAPKSVRILRKELLDAAEANKEAVAASKQAGQAFAKELVKQTTK